MKFSLRLLLFIIIGELAVGAKRIAAEGEVVMVIRPTCFTLPIRNPVFSFTYAACIRNAKKEL